MKSRTSDSDGVLRISKNIVGFDQHTHSDFVDFDEIIGPEQRGEKCLRVMVKEENYERKVKKLTMS